MKAFLVTTSGLRPPLPRWVKVLVWLSSGYFSLCLSSTAVQAQAVLFSDDFSAGLEKWQVLRNSDFYWSVVDGQAEAFIPSGSTLAEMVPKDEYWQDSWHDVEYQLDYTPLQGVDKNISFNFENLWNWYEIHFTENEYNLVRLQDGFTPFNIFNPYIMENGQTYRLRIRFHQGHIQIWVDDQKIADVQDWTFNHNYGKIGIKAGTGAVAPTRVRFDNVVVLTLPDEEPSEGVELLQQTDDRWRAIEYDSASNWSTQPTIGRWGCALTSLVMVMRFYGLQQLPNGRELDPSSVNDWLKSQADGYVGEGMVNWLAATRLTRLISQEFGTPKLEYRRFAGSDLSVAAREIAHSQPVILGIPGHFLVADGLVEEGEGLPPSDLKIKDPSYDFSQLSQHQVPVLSTLTFQPSQTDLSYWLLVHSDQLQVTWKDEHGQQMSQIEVFDEFLSDQVDGTGEETVSQKWQQLPQPTTGNYTLEMSQAELGPFAFQLFAYDVAGNVTDLSQQGWVGSRPLTFSFAYSKDQPSGLEPMVSWSSLDNDVQELYEQRQIQKYYEFYAWRRLVQAADNQSVEQQQRYVALLLNKVRSPESRLTDEARAYLEQQLTYLAQRL